MEEAYRQYRKAWAQTAVDMLLAKIMDHHTRKFSPEQSERVRKVSNQVKEAQTRRRQVGDFDLYSIILV